MKSKFLLLLLIIAPLSSHCQELVYQGTEPIKGIIKVKSNKIYYYDKHGVTQIARDFEKAERIISMDGIQEIFMLSDTSMLCFTNYRVNFVELDKIVFSDSIEGFITSVVKKDSLFFIGTAGNGIIKYNVHSKTQSKLVATSNQFINSLDIINDKLIVGVDEQVMQIDIIAEKIQWTKYLSEAIIKQVNIDDLSNLFVLGEFGKLWQLEFSTGKILRQVVINDNITELYTQNDELYCLGNKGVYVSNKTLNFQQEYKGMYTQLLIEQNQIFSINGNDIFKIDITNQNFQTDFPNFSIFNEADSLVWIGMQGSVSYLRKDSIYNFAKLVKQGEAYNCSAIISTKNYIIAGTMGAGIFIFNRTGGLVRHIFDEKLNQNNNIIQFKKLNELLYIGYLDGVMVLNLKELQVEKDFKGLIGNEYLYSFELISENNFFIGTSTNGLLHYNNGLKTWYLKDQTIYSMTKSNAALFCGTEDDGIYQLDLFKTNAIQKISNLKKVYGLGYYDKLLYVASDNNIQVVNTLNFLNSDFPSLVTGNFQLNAITQSNNNIYFGFETDIKKIHKSKLTQWLSPAVRILSVSLFDQKLDPNKHSFNYTEKTFTFSFEPTNTYQENKYLYKYRLVGLDSIWKSTSNREVSFYNLNPGEYKFQIAIGFNNEFIPKNMTSYEFSIEKPYWQKLWFRFSIILVIGLLIWLYFKNRELKLLSKQQVEKEKLRFEFQNLKNQLDPHFLFNSLNSLIGIVEENPKLASKSIDGLADVYRSILTFQESDKIDISKELTLSEKYFSIHQMRYLNLIELNIQVKNNINGELVPLSCQFLIENAIKHNVISSKHKLKITISNDADYIIVSNNITQKKLHPNSSGIGLENLKQRYQFFTKKPFLVEESKTDFIVKLPIIND